MHESSLAKQILSVVLEKTHIDEPRRIKRVSGWIAETEALTPEALQFHFQAHARQTVAKNAVLNLKLVHVSARCNTCGREYRPEHHLTLCPDCGSSDGSLLSEIGIGIDTIELE